MHYVEVFFAGAALGGSAIGYLAYNYGKKVAAALAVASAAVTAVKKA